VERAWACRPVDQQSTHHPVRDFRQAACTSNDRFNPVTLAERMAHGTPIPEVSAMLGHANVNITLTVYTHFILRMQTDSSSRLAAAIFSGRNRMATKLITLKLPVLFRKLPAWTLQTSTKHGVPQDYPSCVAIVTTPTARTFSSWCPVGGHGKSQRICHSLCSARHLPPWFGGKLASTATGWLLESIKRVAGEGEETEEVRIKRPGAVRPGEDKET
jgi:hypothetical protein